jgi:hypothetical protein
MCISFISFIYIFIGALKKALKLHKVGLSITTVYVYTCSRTYLYIYAHVFEYIIIYLFHLYISFIGALKKALKRHRAGLSITTEEYELLFPEHSQQVKKAYTYMYICMDIYIYLFIYVYSYTFICLYMQL